MAEPHDILAFWTDAGEGAWFKKDNAFDTRCAAFEALHHAAANSELDSWRESAEGALALVLLLDQIPRNIFRGSAHAFATDGLARAIALEAITRGHDSATPMPLRLFFYLPLEHAEDIALQDRCVELVRATGDESYLRYAQLHKDIIARFGRFPHRNTALGRDSTAEEIAFLAEGGFAG